MTPTGYAMLYDTTGWSASSLIWAAVIPGFARQLADRFPGGGEPGRGGQGAAEQPGGACPGQPQHPGAGICEHGAEPDDRDCEDAVAIPALPHRIHQRGPGLQPHHINEQDQTERRNDFGQSDAGVQRSDRQSGEEHSRDAERNPKILISPSR